MLKIFKVTTIVIISVLFFVVGSLSAEEKTDTVIGPYLQNISSDAVTIIWWTDLSFKNGTSKVEYSKASESERLFTSIASEEDAEVTAMEGLYKQQARLDSLEPGISYTYCTVNGDGQNIIKSDQISFSLVPNNPIEFSFVLIGDGQPGTKDVAEKYRNTFFAAKKEAPDIVFCTGDEVDQGAQGQWEIFLRDIICSNGSGTGIASTIPIQMVVGNHEIYEKDQGGYPGGNLSTAMKRFKAICDNPDNESSNDQWKERYYAFGYGPSYFIILDANNTSSDEYDNHEYLGDGETPDWEPGSEQYNWMIEQLKYAKTKYPFTFVLFHPAPFSRGIHGAPREPQTGHKLRVLDPIFRKYRVDAVFTGHDHIVERSVTGPGAFFKKYDRGMQDPRTWRDENNLNYLIQGNSGHSSRSAPAGWQSWIDITGNDNKPFYTAYYFGDIYELEGWEGDPSYTSFNNVDIAWNTERQSWRAVFKTVRVNEKGETSFHDIWWMERNSPKKSLFDKVKSKMWRLFK